MSIASRITAIEEHIRDVYDTIDYSYDTTGVDKNIINIPQNIFNGYINVLNDNGQSLWNNLTKVSASGEEATLENVETAPIKMVLNGNTSQDTTSGIQLFDISKVVTNWNDGKGVKNNNDGTLTVHPPTTSSSTSASSPNTLKDYCPTLQVGDVVYLNATTTGTSKYIYLLTSASVWAFKSARTITQNDLDSRVLWYASGNDTEATISDIIISKTNTTIWEKYTGGIPSPNPDYPQQVKVVKGENVVSVQGKNLINQAELLSSLTYNSTTGYYEGTPSNQFKQEIRLNFKENTSYTFRCEAYQDASSGDALQFYVYYKNGTDSHINLANTTTSTIFKITSTASRTIDYLELKYIRARNIHIKDMCLVEGNDISYVPYSKTDYTINLGTLELCKINTYKDFPFKAINGNEYYDSLTEEQKNALNYGSWYVHKEIGKKIFDGTEYWRAVTTNTADVYRMLTTSLQGSILAPATSSTQFLAFCSRFKPIIADDTYKKIEGISCARDGNVHIYMEDYNTSTSATDFKTWLSTHNVTLYYILATPTEEEITDETLLAQLEAIYKAKSVKDKTFITQTNDELPFILDVEAIKEYEVN